MRQLLSKLLAGGLSAAVILLWYPRLFPSDSPETWLIRGVLWTLCFELLVLAFAPVEERLWETRAARKVRDRIGAGRSRRAGTPVRAIVAAVALAVPIGLLALAPANTLVGKSDTKTTVKHVTEVKRIVRVVRAPGAGSQALAATGPPATARGVTRSRGVTSERASAREPAQRGGDSVQGDTREDGAATDAPAKDPDETQTAAPVADEPAATTQPVESPEPALPRALSS